MSDQISIPDTPSIDAPQQVREAHPTNFRKFFGYSFLALLFAGSLAFSATYLSLAEQPTGSQSALAASPLPDPFADITLEAKSAYVVDLSTYKVLFSKDADVQLPLASITKVMLVLAITEVLSHDSQIVVPPHTPPDGGVKRIPDGSTWKVRDLIDFTLVSSSNEGAEILSHAAEEALRSKYPDAPESGATLWRMNALARELGLVHTYFLNASGLDVTATQSGAYSSCTDIAKLFAHVLKDPSAYEGTAENKLLLYSEEGDRATARNTDRARSEIPGLIMGKTGYTDLAGGNLAVAFDAGPAHPVIVVVLGSSEEGRFSDTRVLVDAAREAITRDPLSLP